MIIPFKELEKICPLFGPQKFENIYVKETPKDMKRKRNSRKEMKKPKNYFAGTDRKTRQMTKIINYIVSCILFKLL